MKNFDYYRSLGIFNEGQLSEIKIAIDHKINVDIFAKPEYSADQMFFIANGMFQGLDVSYYLNPQLTHGTMQNIRDVLYDSREKLHKEINHLILDN